MTPDERHAHGLGCYEYWLDPAQEIRETYCIIKSGGVELMISSLEPADPLSHGSCAWRLFPRDEDYQQWFKTAGFRNIRAVFIRPQWYRGKEACAVAIAEMKPKQVLLYDYRSVCKYHIRDVFEGSRIPF